VALTWSDGLYDGGSPVLDYQVEYKETSLTDYSIYQTNVLSPALTITGLTPGSFYDVVVRSRNVVGLSDVSEEITI
jgi:hypothetical protein